MRLLANENIPQYVVDILREKGYDVTWIHIDAPGSSDEEALARARTEKRILITFDKDFGELVFRSRRPGNPGVILLRIPMISSEYVARLVVEILTSRTDWEGHFSGVEEDRVRMRALHP